MIQRVLVPIDTVREDHPALLEAQRRFPEAELHLLHVVPPPDPASPSPGAQEADRARRVMADLGLGEVVQGPSPAAEILSRVQSRAFDLVVMGTAGQRGLDRLLLGSVARRLIQESPVPVITVRLETEPPPSHAPAPRTLMLHDLSPAADQTLAFVRRALPQTEVALMHVVQARLSEDRRAAARTFLQERGGGRIVQGDPVDMAMVQARSGSYDLIALAASSRGRLDRLLFGSVADRLVRESPVPVLTLRS